MPGVRERHSSLSVRAVLAWPAPRVKCRDVVYERRADLVGVGVGGSGRLELCHLLLFLVDVASLLGLGS
jgi:hypothetical protein